MSCKLSVYIFDNKPKLFLWCRFNEHLQTTFDSFCPANLKFRGWRPDFGKILFNVSTGTTLHCALISILQDIVVQSENIPMGKICPILSNTDKSFWVFWWFIISRKNFHSSAKSDSVSVRSISSNGFVATLMITFSVRRDIYHGYEKFWKIWFSINLRSSSGGLNSIFRIFLFSNLVQVVSPF